MRLRDHAISGARWSAAGALSRAGLQILQLTLLARLLGPDEVGLAALATAIFFIAQLLADAGLSNSIIHFRTLTQRESSSLFWLNLVIAATIAGLLAVSAPLIASWYSNAHLQPLLYVSAIALVLSAVGQQIRVKALRDFQFSALTRIELGSAVAGFSTALCAALLGAGAVSVALGSAVSAAVSACCAWKYLRAGWIPSAVFAVGETRRFFSYGFYSIVNSVIGGIVLQLDVLIAGRIYAAEAIAMFSVPKTLMLNVQALVNPAVARVSLPLIAAVQNDVVAVGDLYRRTLLIAASINFPIYVILAVCAEQAAAVLLGPEFDAAATFLRIYAIWGLARSIGNPVGALLSAVGRNRDELVWNAVWLPLTAAGAFFASTFGILWLALTMAAVPVMQFFPLWYFLVRRGCALSFRRYCASVMMPLLCAMMSGAGAWLMLAASNSLSQQLMLSVMVGCIVYAGATWIFNKEFVDLILRVVREQRAKE